MGDSPIHHAGVKLVTAVGVAMTIDLWTTIGKLCAASYSILILGEWVWKRVIRPHAVRRGWLSVKE